MARYSVQKRIGKAIQAAIALGVMVAVWSAFAPSTAVFDTPIGQLTINSLFVPLLWLLLGIAWLRAVATLLFEAIVGRDDLSNRHDRARGPGDRETRPPSGPAPAADSRPAALPGWLKRDRDQRA